MEIWDVNAYNIVTSKSVETKIYFKYLIWYFDEVIRPLVLLLPKINGYIKTFRDKSGNKNKNNKLMSLCINNNKPLEKYKTIWMKIENLKNFELDALPVYDD